MVYIVVSEIIIGCWWVVELWDILNKVNVEELGGRVEVIGREVLKREIK